MYRTETLLSALENRPPRLQLEELDLGLPSTFALWNSPGFHVFESRFEEEPCLRFVHKLHQLAGNPPLNVPPVPLIEDIHHGLCGLWPLVWRYARMRHLNQELDAAAASTVEKLEFWKIRLQRFAERYDDHLGPSALFLRAAYRGTEQQPPTAGPDWAMRRQRGLLAETTALYHFFGMHMSADLPALRPLARPPSSGRSAIAADSEPNGRLREWTGSQRGRQALLHAVATLRGCEEARMAVAESAAVPSPIVRTALSASISVMRAWMLGLGGCAPGGHGGSVVDLAQVAQSQDSDPGNWKRGGGPGPLLLDGVLLCSCAEDAWARRFSSVLSGG